MVTRAGSVHAFHMAHADKVMVIKIVADNISKEGCLHADKSCLYFGTSEDVAAYEIVRNSCGEYVRRNLHTDLTGGYFGNLNRRMKEVYQHCDQKHQLRYGIYVVGGLSAALVKRSRTVPRDDTDFWTFAGNSAALQDIMYAFGNIGCMIADALDVLGAKQQMHS